MHAQDAERRPITGCVTRSSIPSGVHRRSGPASSYPAHLAAMFIYLNRTGYNGLFRLNSQRGFQRAGRPLCRAADLRRADPARRGRRSRDPHGDPASPQFAAVAASAGPGDLVLSSIRPYAPLSATPRFTSYTAGSFSDEDQRTLQAVVVQLAGRGCAVIVSNSTAYVVSRLYQAPEARRAGLEDLPHPGAPCDQL